MYMGELKFFPLPTDVYTCTLWEASLLGLWPLFSVTSWILDYIEELNIFILNIFREIRRDGMANGVITLMKVSGKKVLLKKLIEVNLSKLG